MNNYDEDCERRAARLISFDGSENVGFLIFYALKIGGRRERRFSLQISSACPPPTVVGSDGVFLFAYEELFQ